MIVSVKGTLYRYCNGDGVKRNEDIEEETVKLIKERIESRKVKRRKDEEHYEVLEEVFDRATLLALYDLVNKGYIERIYGVVATGKEARIYWAEDPSGNDIALKIFLIVTAEFWKRRKRYIDGDPRFVRIRRSRRHLIKAWCSKEFKNLKLAYEAGVRVPKPIVFKENVLVMEFINAPGERGVPAPLLKDAPPTDPHTAFEVIMDYVEKLYKNAKLVHADLSEYNILNREPEFVIIDWGSAVLLAHPNAHEFLMRDISNVTNYFKRLGVDVPDPKEIYSSLVSEHH